MDWGVSLVHGEFGRHLSLPSPTAFPGSFLAAGFGVISAGCLELVAVSSDVFQDESASISEIDFRDFPTCAGGLVPEFGRVGWGFVIVGWNPGTDGLPGRFDGLERFIRPPHLAGSPCGLRVDFASLALRAAYRQSVSLRSTRLRPKRLRSLGVFRCRRVARTVAEG